MANEPLNHAPASQDTAVNPQPMPWRDFATEALRYWEPRRLLYNGILALIVLVHFSLGMPESTSFLSFDNLLLVFFLAVLANVCYCGAYVVDMFVQLSGFRAAWSRWRWIVLLLGILFASTITHFFAMGMFMGSHY